MDLNPKSESKMPGFPCVDMVRGGVKLQDVEVLTAHAWWVVYVTSGLGSDCVYGGRPTTVAKWLDQHAADCGVPVEVVAFPFENGLESLAARLEIERHYTEKKRAQSHRPVVCG